MSFDPSWRVTEDELAAEIGAADGAFAALELVRPLALYEARLRRLGLVGRARVLDAACGLGQWSVALRRLNDEVHAVDLAGGRLRGAALLARRSDLDVRLARADLTALPYPDATFDAVCCYGVLMLAPASRALRELARVTRPGGVLYVCANGLGWSLYVMLRRRWLRRGARTIVRTLLRRERDTFITRRRFERMCRAAGLRLDGWGKEGHLPSGLDPEAPPFYRGRFLGAPCVWEALATRTGAP